MKCDFCEKDKNTVVVLPYKPNEFVNNPQPPIKICNDCLIAAQKNGRDDNEDCARGNVRATTTNY